MIVYKNHFGKLLLLFLPLLIVSGCSDNPCPDEEPSKSRYFYISEAIKKAVPYRTDGLDTLVYISETGDSAVLIGTGKVHYTERVLISRNGNPDCPFYDYEYVEHVKYNFINIFSNGVSQIQFKQSPTLGSSADDFLTITIDDHYLLTNQEFANDEEWYIDAVIINDSTYLGRTLYGNNKFPLIYNYKNGILQFTLNYKKWKLKR